jgi:uncharacterized membrane protein
MFARSTAALIFTAAIGSGLVAGVFFAFSSFVMPALARIRPDQGIAAMQSINVTVINPGFMLALFGTALLGVVLAFGALTRWGQPGQAYVLAAGILYVLGSAGVTMVCNVPLNDALAAVQANNSDGATLWVRFLEDWTFWNHIRAAASTAAFALYIAAFAAQSG